MPGDEFDREMLRALDPAMQGGLDTAQHDQLARAIVAAWLASLPLTDDGPSESAVYVKVARRRR